MSRLWILLPLVGACVPRASAPDPAPDVRWVPVEAEVARLDYGAGDGAVSTAARVLVLTASVGPSRRRLAPPVLRLPARVEVGEIFRIMVQVPRANAGDVRVFRLIAGRPGLRLIDGDLVVTRGRAPSERRAVADSAGPATFDLEESAD